MPVIPAVDIFDCHIQCFLLLNWCSREMFGAAKLIEAELGKTNLHFKVNIWALPISAPTQAELVVSEIIAFPVNSSKPAIPSCANDTIMILWCFSKHVSLFFFFFFFYEQSMYREESISVFLKKLVICVQDGFVCPNRHLSSCWSIRFEKQQQPGLVLDFGNGEFVFMIIFTIGICRDCLATGLLSGRGSDKTHEFHTELITHQSAILVTSITEAELHNG